ncbi:hypothetical protein [Dyadobacter arcticus]|uniref:Uncharacterized protein n=1 Tax=Dyadobacter arcticus TaxID=1078754 RepID=A0ABX0UH06_9BACT|nr:hypothetical protein [Dyadobacter arcticus]NIJ52291.1 hypothetical protein [Dyadobacter arcticus]
MATSSKEHANLSLVSGSSWLMEGCTGKEFNVPKVFEDQLSFSFEGRFEPNFDNTALVISFAS